MRLIDDLDGESPFLISRVAIFEHRVAMIGSEVVFSTESGPSILVGGIPAHRKIQDNGDGLVLQINFNASWPAPRSAGEHITGLGTGGTLEDDLSSWKDPIFTGMVINHRPELHVFFDNSKITF